MQKLHITEVPVGSIIWRADLNESGPHGQHLQTYQGFVNADEIDETEFVQTLWDQLKCVGDLNITMMQGGHESKLIINAGCDETGTDIHEVNYGGGECPDFAIGEYAQSLRAEES